MRKLLIALFACLVISTTAVIGVENITLDNRVAQIILLFQSRNRKRDGDQFKIQQIYRSSLATGAERK